MSFPTSHPGASPSPTPSEIGLTLVGLPAAGAGEAAVRRTAAAARAVRTALDTADGPLGAAALRLGPDALETPASGADGAVGPMLILLPEPVEQVALALMAGLPGDEALGAWRRMAGTLTEFLERRANAAFLIWDRVAFRAPGAVVAGVAGALGLADVRTPDAGLTEEADPAPIPALRLIEAELLLARASDAARIAAALAPHRIEVPGRLDAAFRADLAPGALLPRAARQDLAAESARPQPALESRDATALRQRAEQAETERREAEASHRLEIDRHMAEIARLTRDLDRQRAAVKRLEAAAAERDRAHRKALDAAGAKPRAALDKARAEIARLSEGLEKARARARDEEKKAATLKARRASIEALARTEIDKLAATLEKTQARLRGSVSREAAEEEARAAVRAAEEALRQTMQDRQATETDRLKRRIEAVQIRARTAEESAARQTDALEAAQAHIAAVERSISWRLTRPLRGVRRLFSR